MMVPGEYAEIQTVHRDDTSPFLAEIEKDVTRTFPGNIYFGERKRLETFHHYFPQADWLRRRWSRCSQA